MLLVALDALDISLLRRALDEGRLPNLKAFLDGALEAEVHSDGERMEGSVWPTFASGLGPAVHGHHWFMQWMAEDGAFVLTSDPRLAIEPFWKAALEAGKRVTIFDLPYVPAVGHALERTYTGWGVQDEMEEHAHPKAFRKEILQRHGRSLTRKDTMLVHTPGDRANLARRSKASSRQRSAVLQDLAGRRDWDLLIFGYGEFHRAGHHLALPMDLGDGATNETAMMNLLQPLDQAWPAILAAAGEDCDIGIFALHGMHPRIGWGHLMQDILDDMAGKPPAGPPKRDILRRLRDAVPPQIHENIWLRLPAEYRMSRVAKGWSQRMDVAHDQIILLEGDCAVAFRVNLAGREREGVVPAGEARAAAERFWAELQRYRTPDGAPAFGELVVTADRSAGPRLDRLPDFSITYAPGVTSVAALVRDDGFTIQNTAPVSRNGSHTSRGFLFLRPATPASLRRDQLKNQDFAPTILERLGVTPPGQLEGVTVLA